MKPLTGAKRPPGARRNAISLVLAFWHGCPRVARFLFSANRYAASGLLATSRSTLVPVSLLFTDLHASSRAPDLLLISELPQLRSSLSRTPGGIGFS